MKKILQRQLPDITCRYGSDTDAPRRSNDLHDTFYHELGHAQHYGQVGNDFWTAYIAYVLTYGNADNPYGQKTNSDASRIAISEGWANYVERLFIDDKYRSTSPTLASNAIFRLENQVPYDSDTDGWFVYGMLYDMTDVGEPTGIRGTGVTDNVDAFNAAAVFRGLRPEANSVRSYQEVIRLQNNNLQSFAMEQLVTSYRW